MIQFPDAQAEQAELLKELKDRLTAAIQTLDAHEPKKEGTEAYDQWAQLHEDAEDMLDEVLDRLEDPSGNDPDAVQELAEDIENYLTFCKTVL